MKFLYMMKSRWWQAWSLESQMMLSISKFSSINLTLHWIHPFRNSHYRANSQCLKASTESSFPMWALQWIRWNSGLMMMYLCLELHFLIKWTKLILRSHLIQRLCIFQVRLRIMLLFSLKRSSCLNTIFQMMRQWRELPALILVQGTPTQHHQLALIHKSSQPMDMMMTISYLVTTTNKLLMPIVNPTFSIASHLEDSETNLSWCTLPASEATALMPMASKAWPQISGRESTWRNVTLWKRIQTSSGSSLTIKLSSSTTKTGA